MSDFIPRAWLMFRGSEIQRELDKHLRETIELKRSQLEHVKPDELSALQAEIRQCRSFLKTIHQHDTVEIRQTYA